MQITHRGTPALALSGYVVWPGWDDTDPHRHGAPYVVPAVDEQGRVARWQARSLAAVLSWLHGIETLSVDELVESMGLDVLEDDRALVAARPAPHPMAEDWASGDGF